VSHLGAPPAVEFLDRDTLVVPDRNKADLAAFDKRTNEVHAGPERLGGLALREQYLEQLDLHEEAAPASITSRTTARKLVTAYPGAPGSVSIAGEPMPSTTRVFHRSPSSRLANIQQR
jgi:hypothetical protein